jgi:hypothetical protein
MTPNEMKKKARQLLQGGCMEARLFFAIGEKGDINV